MLNILYCDSDLLILNKPPGLLCVPGLSDPDNLYDRARRSYPNIRVVHRLDMATSGIVVFALNYPAQKHLNKQFEKRDVKKRYIAEVSGIIKSHVGEIVAPMICDWERRPKQKIDWANGKPAHTIFRVTANTPHTTRVQLFPITGRSHQLRVHCQHLGTPIVGDALYNESSTHERLLLHAEFICFTHPKTESLIEFEAPAPF